MRKQFYRFLTTLVRKGDNPLLDRLAQLIVQGIAAGYYLFQPRRVAVGLDFYQALFPGKRRIFYRRLVWQQYRNFTSVYLDRLRLGQHTAIQYTCEGWEYLEQVRTAGRGGVILMSHLGNWELAAHLMKQAAPDLPLLLYMGIQAREAIEGIQKAELAAGGIQIHAVDQQGGSPLDLLAGLNFIQSGGFVSMTGDRLWHESQRWTTATFLNRQIRLPEAPHLFALLSGAPILTFFSFRTAPRSFHFTLSAPRYLKAPSRRERAGAIAASAQAYADLLEAALRRHPGEWYHFEPFLGSRVAGEDLKSEI